MTGSSQFALEIGALVADKYRVEEPILGAAGRPVYRGTVLATHEPAVLFVLSATEARGLGGGVDVEHAHLARVLELALRPAGDQVLVVEHVKAVTLDRHLAEQGPLPHVEAVRAALRLADALATVHQAGLAHGLVRPGSVLFSPDGRSSPVLSFAPPLEQSSPYRSPERGSSGLASPADDTWALAGLLHEMLTGRPPPTTGVSTPDDLRELKIGDAVIETVLARGLATARSQRVTDVTSLKRELVRWYVEHAADDEDESKPPTHAPPPLPASAVPPLPASAAPLPSAAPSVVERTVRPATVAPVKRPRWALWVALVALPLGALASWGVASLVSKDEVVVEVPRPAASSAVEAPASASPASIDLSDVPLTGQSLAATGDPMATCVAGYLPKGAFSGEPPDLGWLCSESDARSGARKLHSAVVQGAGGKVTDAMKLMSQLGWFQMAAFSVVFAGCCPEGKPLELPEPVEGCPAMAAPLTALGVAVVAQRSHDAAFEALRAAIDCEVKAKRAREFGQKRAPTATEAAAFAGFVAAFRQE